MGGRTDRPQWLVGNGECGRGKAQCLGMEAHSRSFMHGGTSYEMGRRWEGQVSDEHDEFSGWAFQPGEREKEVAKALRDTDIRRRDRGREDQEVM